MKKNVIIALTVFLIIGGVWWINPSTKRTRDKLLYLWIDPSTKVKRGKLIAWWTKEYGTVENLEGGKAAFLNMSEAQINFVYEKSYLQGLPLPE